MNVHKKSMPAEVCSYSNERFQRYGSLYALYQWTLCDSCTSERVVTNLLPSVQMIMVVDVCENANVWMNGWTQM